MLEPLCCVVPFSGKEGDPLMWPARVKIAMGTAEGLAYLHNDAKLIHRDIKVHSPPSVASLHDSG